MALETGLLRSLEEIVGASAISNQEALLERYAGDALSRRAPSRLIEARTLPLAVVRPQTTEQVMAIVKLASRERLPLVPYGGGTGLMGGAWSVRPGLVLDLKGMNRIVAIDEESRVAVAQAGVILEDLEAELGRRGLLLGHDPWTIGSATVGGAISTNGLGYRGGKYGPMGHQVLGLEVVLADGSLVRTRPVATSSTGIDLNHLFIGTEGTLGLITQATLRAFPAPEKRMVRALSVPSFEQGFAAVTKIFGLGMRPAALDFGEEDASSWLEDPSQPTPPGPPVLYLVFEGFKEEVNAQWRRASAICREAGGKALGAAEAWDFWENRHLIAERYRRVAQGLETQPPRPSGVRFDFVHVALPLSQVLEYRRRSLPILEQHRVRLAESGIWTQPELYSLAMVTRAPSDEEAEARMTQTVDELLALAQDLGGSMEYCHGVGLRLAHLMAREHGLGLEVMRRIKAALDPLNIINPGKLAL